MEYKCLEKLGKLFRNIKTIQNETTRMSNRSKIIKKWFRIYSKTLKTLKTLNKSLKFVQNSSEIFRIVEKSLEICQKTLRKAW